MTTSAAFTWADFYLICFAVGFGFSFLSFVLGGGSRFGRLHLPHHFPHVGHGIPHGPVGHGPIAHGPVSGAPGAHGAGGHAPAQPGARGMRGGVSIVNPPTIAAFLAWFGGTGYLLTRYSTLWVGLSLLASIVSGLAGGTIIFLFLSRVLMSTEEEMDPADYEMVGVLGKLSVPIRQGGTGELLYSQMGTRRVCGARSDNGEPISKGTEVVVTRYDKGIAYVRLFSEMSGEQE